MRKDAAGWNLERISETVLKHSIWLMIAWWTGGAWVLYFNDAPTLVKQLITFQAPMIAYIWIGILTATTYVLAGWMREQVCVYMRKLALSCTPSFTSAVLLEEEKLTDLLACRSGGICNWK